jgi:uncharacterized membrane protein
MEKARMETFSDGVIAILITIMVLELRSPAGATADDLATRLPEFLTYVLSFVYLGIYWNNHHHMLQATHRINGGILWANLHLLFWLSLIPFFTAWMGASHFATVPDAFYGGVLLAAALAYYILQTAIVAEEGPESTLAVALGRDLKSKVSLAIYAASIPLTFANRWIAVGGYVIVALIWLVPDRRVEARFREG